MAASAPPSLLVKGDHLERVLRMAVPLVPSAPLARVALLGGYGSFGAVMGQFIPPIRELPPTARLADQQEVDEKGMLRARLFAASCVTVRGSALEPEIGTAWVGEGRGGSRAGAHDLTTGRRRAWPTPAS